MLNLATKYIWNSKAIYRCICNRHFLVNTSNNVMFEISTELATVFGKPNIVSCGQAFSQWLKTYGLSEKEAAALLDSLYKKQVICIEQNLKSNSR